MKESEKGERRPRCVKKDVCNWSQSDKEMKAPGKNTSGLMRQSVRGTLENILKGKRN